MSPATTKATTTQQGRTREKRSPRPPTSTAAPKPKVRRISEGLYWCESLRHPGSGHRTTEQSCTCPAGTDGPDCRHKKAVRAIERYRREQLALRAAPVPVAQVMAPTAELAPLWARFA